MDQRLLTGLVSLRFSSLADSSPSEDSVKNKIENPKHKFSSSASEPACAKTVAMRAQDSTGVTIPLSTFFGLFTRELIGHIFMRSKAV
jgi:hypothetical protein